MPKNKNRTYDLIIDSTCTRQDTYNIYYNKYFNLFMNAYNFNGLNYQQRDYFLRRMWADGRIASFIIKDGKGLPLKTEKHPNGELVFTPFAPNKYNIYDYPIDVTLVNKRGVKFIPVSPQVVDKDVVIGYAQRNKKSVEWVVKYYIGKIVDIEMTIRTNLKAQKNPILLACDSESENKVKNFMDNIDEDNPYIFVNLDSPNGAKALVSGAPYNIDKLYNQKCAYENELREYLGINNMGVVEKKEHLIGDEIAVNNEIVSSSGDCFFDTMQEFWERIKELFGYEVIMEVNATPMMEEDTEDEESKDKDKENEDKE